MLKASRLRSDDVHKYNERAEKRFTSKVRINLNDLLQKRKEEKKVDRKNNLLIISGASAAAVFILAILII